MLDACDKIQSNPYVGDQLSRVLKGYRSFHVTNTNPQYRILYRIYLCQEINKLNLPFCTQKIEHTKTELKKCDGLVDFLDVGSREMFYAKYRTKKGVKHLKR